MAISIPTLDRRAFLGGVAAAGGALALAGCSGNNGDTGSSANAQTDDADATPDKTQELFMVFTDLSTLDVNDIRNSNEFLVLSQVQEGLFRTFTKEGKDELSNAGCESYEVSDDGLTYTFKLRKNTWSDGEPVVAQHYVDSILRLVNPDNGFSYSFMASDIAGAQAYMDGEGSVDDIAVRAVDDYTLEIKLAAPIPFFKDKLANACFFPIRKDLIDQYGENMSNDYTKQVYCGPFCITDRVRDNTLTIEPNEKYWDADNIILDRVTYTVVNEDATKSQLLSSQQLDAVKGTTEYVKKWQKEAKSGSLVEMDRPSASVTYLAFNQHSGGPSGLMNNPKVRQAISLSLDRDDFNNTIYSGNYTPAYGLIPGGISVGDKEYREETDEPLKALIKKYDSKKKIVKLFKEGVKEVTGSDDISKVEFTVLGQTTSTQAKNQLEWLQQSVQDALGVTVTINAQGESASFVAERNANNYDFYIMGWLGDYNEPLTFMDLWYTGSGYAKFMGGYSNETFDKDYAALATEADNDKRLELYQEMEKNLVADFAGMAPLVYEKAIFFKQPYVKELSIPQFGTEFEVSRTFISGK